VAATGAGTIAILDVNCRHERRTQDQLGCSHRRVVESGAIWDVSCDDDVMATANERGTVELYGLASG
jgi:hypothetical protein